MPSTLFANAGALLAAVLMLTPPAPAASQTLHDFVEAASARSPDLAGLSGRRDAIGSRQLAADALTPGAPTLSGSYVTDQALVNRQQREAQVGVSTPLWLPGEGTASRRVADAEFSRSTALAAAIKLKIAGQVRDSLAEVALAQAERTVAERRLRDARGLEADVGRRVRSREASEADLLLARSERIAAEGELGERRALLEQSKLEFQSLTGMPAVTAALQESAVEATKTPHPRIEDAKGAVEVARASKDLAGIQVRESPEIGVIARRNRDIYGTVFDNSVGVEIRIPFATEARNRPRQAAAQAELTEASATLIAAQRETETGQQKARIFYDNAAAQRDLARQRARALSQQSLLIGRAYQGGETSLLDYVRARALGYDAEMAASRAEIGVARARGRLNQAYGVVP